MLNKYCELLQTIVSPIESSTREVYEASDQIAPDMDIELTCTNLGTGPNQPEQLLLDYFVRSVWAGLGVCVVMM